ncbi:MAG TPA: Uma2 family endonuclease [Thermoanaerobaculia bacterium]
MAKVLKRHATYEDLLRVPPELVAEIVDGELVTSPRPATPHARTAGAIYRRIGDAFDDGDGGPGGWWILSEPEIHLRSDVLVPDIAGWRHSTLPVMPSAAALTIVPDWICEVLSPSNEIYDRRKKMPTYARHGVQWAWVVDPIERLIEVSRLTEGFWLNVGTYAGDETARMEPFEAIEIPLSRLWLTVPPAP